MSHIPLPEIIGTPWHGLVTRKPRSLHHAAWIGTMIGTIVRHAHRRYHAAGCIAHITCPMITSYYIHRIIYIVLYIPLQPGFHISYPIHPHDMARYIRTLVG